MLLRFAASNFRSLRDKQEFSLTASSLRDGESGLIQTAALPGRKVLPVAVIYGANASGKSNVVAALLMMRTAVIFSHSRGEPGGGIPRKPFALDPLCAKLPSSMEADFILEGVRYHYGFEFSDEAFLSEWLYSFSSGRQIILFTRDKQKFRFGRSLKGRNRVIADLTRPNSLFLSAATQNDHEQLSKLATFFRQIRADREISVTGQMASMRLGKKVVDKRVIEFLARIGTGVVDIKQAEEELSEELQSLRNAVLEVLRKFTKEAIDTSQLDNVTTAIELGHKGRDGNPVFLNLDDESAGTRRLLIILGEVFTAIEQGVPLIIDELDASLHTQACEAIIALFSSTTTNPNGSQLIATTHDTNLLRLQFLRRDQVWFTEKDEQGATHLYPLTEFRTRQGDNVEKGYLQGRFGAIPFPGSVAELVVG